MIKIVYLTSADKRLWDNLVKRSPESGFMQSWAWSEFKQAEGQKVIRLGLVENDLLVGGAMIYYVESSVIPSPLEMPHGPVLPWKDKDKTMRGMQCLLQELAAISEKTGSPVARIEPFIEGCFPDFMDKLVRAPLDLIPTPTLLVPISGSDQEILSAMTQKGRYNIKRSQRHGVAVNFAQSVDAVDDFYSLFELTCSRHDFSGEPISFFKNMIAFLGPTDMARIYFARCQGILLASAIAVFFGDRATYLYGGSAPFYSTAMASYALHWHMMTEARAQGCRLYDFYGIVPEDQTFHPYAKFSQFKMRFGGQKTELVGAHDLYFYDRLADLWARNLVMATTAVNK